MRKPSAHTFRSPVEEAEYSLRWWKYQGSPGKVEMWEQILQERIELAALHEERYVVIEVQSRPEQGYAARNAVLDLHAGRELGRLFDRKHAELLRDALAGAEKPHAV